MLEYSMFERLPLHYQTETLSKKGLILGQRTYNGWAVTLYTLNDAFVELWSGNGMAVTSTFKKSADALAVLAPYVDAVDIAAWMQTEK